MKFVTLRVRNAAPYIERGVGEPNVGIVEKFRFLKVPLNNARGREGGGGGGGVGGGGSARAHARVLAPTTGLASMAFTHYTGYCSPPACTCTSTGALPSSSGRVRK
jgi:hypothetical protein